MSDDITIMLLWQEYIKYQSDYTKKYGDKCICLMQVGKFYELYSLDNTGYIKDIADLLNIIVSRKNKNKEDISRDNPYMAGVPIDRLDKYLPPLIDANYTVVIIDQTEEKTKLSGGREFDRKVSRIVSKATVFNLLDTKIVPDANFILSIYLEDVDVGFALLDISTGKTIINQISSKTHHIADEIFRFVETFNPMEIIVNSYKYKPPTLPEINAENRIVHVNPAITQTDVFKVSYQNTLLKKVYANHGFLSPIEYINLEHKPEARTAFILLLQFAYEHDDRNIKNLQVPEHYQDTKYLIIYNNALHQLDICSKRHSLFEIINKTSSAIGKRELHHRICNPIIDPTKLNERYQLVADISPHISALESLLSSLVDIERFNRKIQLRNIHPFELCQLIDTYITVKQIIDYLTDKQIKPSTLQQQNDTTGLSKLIEQAAKKFNKLEMAKYSKDDIKTNIFNVGIYSDIDVVQQAIDNANGSFDNWKDLFNQIIRESSSAAKRKTAASGTAETFVHLEYCEKPPISYYFTCSKTRADVIKRILPECIIETHRSTDYKIMSKELQENSDKLVKNTSRISDLLSAKFQECIEEIAISFDLNWIVKFIGEIDVAVSSAKCAIQYKYCRPTIIANTSTNDNKSESRIHATNLRHPIVERLRDDVYYVPNDVNLSREGMLLYGVNACGKSTYMKSVGTSIILAQMGMYVPADKFEYYPYRHLFTRITGEDNLFTGHSSFAVEMSELRSILKYADESSIVLGDEICRGTEAISGISIVAAAVRRFSTKKVAFIFATHLQKLAEMECIAALKNVRLYHLEVSADSNGVLTYNRKLKDGAGQAIYGLEVARCMIPDKDFIEDAVRIRREIMGESLALVQENSSRYNANVYVDSCQITGCKNRDDQLDVHHIKFQSHCDEYGYIGHIPKNIKGNLVVLCKSHHNDVHAGKIEVRGYKETSEGITLDYC